METMKLALKAISVLELEQVCLLDGKGSLWVPQAASLFQIKYLHQGVAGGKKGSVPRDPG